MDKDAKREASLPVQSRIDIRSLATACRYWEGEGVYIDTMSKLVSWSMDLLVEILSRNDRLNTVYSSMTEAINYLEGRGLYSPGSGSGKGRKKAAIGMRFESMKLSGIDPKFENSKDYNMTHNKGSVEVSDIGNPSKSGTVVFTEESLAGWEAERKRKERTEMVEEAKERDKKALSEIKYDDDGVCIREPVPDDTADLIPASNVVQPKPRQVKNSDLARPLSNEEVDAKSLAREKKERAGLEALKNMNSPV